MWQQNFRTWDGGVCGNSSACGSRISGLGIVVDVATIVKLESNWGDIGATGLLNQIWVLIINQIVLVALIMIVMELRDMTLACNTDVWSCSEGGFISGSKIGGQQLWLHWWCGSGIGDIVFVTVIVALVGTFAMLVLDSSDGGGRIFWRGQWCLVAKMLNVNN